MMKDMTKNVHKTVDHSDLKKRRRHRTYVSPFSEEEQFYIRFRLGLHNTTSNFLTNPAQRVKDSIQLCTAWTSISILGAATVAGVLGGRAINVSGFLLS